MKEQNVNSNQKIGKERDTNSDSNQQKTSQPAQPSAGSNFINSTNRPNSTAENSNGNTQDPGTTTSNNMTGSVSRITSIKSYFSIDGKSSHNSLEMTKSDIDLFSPKLLRINSTAKRMRSPQSDEQNKERRIDKIFSSNILENSISELERNISQDPNIGSSLNINSTVELNSTLVPICTITRTIETQREINSIPH